MVARARTPRRIVSVTRTPHARQSRAYLHNNSISLHAEVTSRRERSMHVQRSSQTSSCMRASMYVRRYVRMPTRVRRSRLAPSKCALACTAHATPSPHHTRTASTVGARVLTKT